MFVYQRVDSMSDSLKLWCLLVNGSIVCIYLCICWLYPTYSLIIFHVGRWSAHLWLRKSTTNSQFGWLKKQLRCMFESKLWCMPVPRKLSYTVIDMEKWPPRMPDFLMEWQRKVAPLRCPQHPSALLLIFSSKIHRKSTKFCSEDFMMAKTMPFLWPFAPSSHRHF